MKNADDLLAQIQKEGEISYLKQYDSYEDIPKYPKMINLTNGIITPNGKKSTYVGACVPTIITQTSVNKFSSKWFRKKEEFIINKLEVFIDLHNFRYNHEDNGNTFFGNLFSIPVIMKSFTLQSSTIFHELDMLDYIDSKLREAIFDDLANDIDKSLHNQLHKYSENYIDSMKIHFNKDRQYLIESLSKMDSKVDTIASLRIRKLSYD